MKQDKKAQTELIFNVVVGLIAIAIIFVIMYFMSSKLEDMKYDEIRDAQKIEVMDSFLPMISEMNSSLYSNYSDLVKGNIPIGKDGAKNKIVSGFIIGKEYQTYLGDIAKMDDFYKVFPDFNSGVIIPVETNEVSEIPVLTLVDPYILVLYTSLPGTGKIASEDKPGTKIKYIEQTSEGAKMRYIEQSQNKFKTNLK